MTEPQDFSFLYDGRVLCVHVCVGRELDVVQPLMEALVAACRGPELHANMCWAERFSRDEALLEGSEVKRVAEASACEDVFVFHVFINTDQDRDQVELRARVVAQASPGAVSVLIEEYVGEAAQHVWSMVQDLTDPSTHIPKDVGDTEIGVPAKDLKMLRILTCGTHGPRKWQGHVMCSSCGRVFQTTRKDKPRFAPFECRCGVQLLPDEEDRIGDVMGLFNKDGTMAMSTAGGVSIQLSPYEECNFSSRAICDHCYRKIDKKFDGKVPNYEEAMKKLRAEAKVIKN